MRHCLLATLADVSTHGRWCVTTTVRRRTAVQMRRDRAVGAPTGHALVAPNRRRVGDWCVSGEIEKLRIPVVGKCSGRSGSGDVNNCLSLYRRRLLVLLNDSAPQLFICPYSRPRRAQTSDSVSADSHVNIDTFVNGHGVAWCFVIDRKEKKLAVANE